MDVREAVNVRDNGASDWGKIHAHSLEDKCTKVSASWETVAERRYRIRLVQARELDIQLCSGRYPEEYSCNSSYGSNLMGNAGSRSMVRALSKDTDVPSRLGESFLLTTRESRFQSRRTSHTIEPEDGTPSSLSIRFCKWPVFLGTILVLCLQQCQADTSETSTHSIYDG
jgi:hypothetical protein